MLLPYTTAGFDPAQTAALTAHPVRPRGRIRVTHARMAWAATTIGAAPVGLGGIGRPRAELTWRAAMVEATLRQTRNPRRWTRTRAYDRLDPSEKSAVSYFHGMIGARLLTEELLRVPMLVHLDAVLAHLGAPTGRSRPDFVGYHPTTGTYSLALEAKGRSRGWSEDPVASAKTQAGRLPAVFATTTTINAPSLTYFEDEHWAAHLEDPPTRDVDYRPLPPGVVVAVHYLPVVHAMVQLEDQHLRHVETAVTGKFAESGITVQVPRFVFDPLTTIPVRQDRRDPEAVNAAGDDIGAAWRTRALEAEAGLERTPDASGKRGDGPGDASAHRPPSESGTAGPGRPEPTGTPSPLGEIARPSVEILDAQPDQATLRKLELTWTGTDLITVMLNETWPILE